MIYTKIRDLALKKKVSIRKVERDCDFANGTLSKWNKSIPSVENLKRVANYFGITIDELLDDKQVTH